jgi:DNA mismatch repair ATPase MutS
VYLEPTARWVFCCLLGAAAHVGCPPLLLGWLKGRPDPTPVGPDLTTVSVFRTSALRRNEGICLRGMAVMPDAATHEVIEFGRTRRSARPGGQIPGEDRAGMPFYSILFERADDRVEAETVEAPAFFTDLNCDQIVDAIVAGKEEYNLKPFFYTCLRSVDAVNYRHDVMRDLENPQTLECVRSFAEKMREMRQYLDRVRKLYYKEQKQAWFLDAIEGYCETVSQFSNDLSKADLLSHGFLHFSEYLETYVGSSHFASLLSESEQLRADLSEVQYCVLINGDRFTVRRCNNEPDYSAEVEQTFEKFKQGATKDYKAKFAEREEMNHIEAKVLEFVAKLHPDVFGALNEYCVRNDDFLDPTIVTFDREIQFYLSYLDYIDALRKVGLRFTYPRMSNVEKAVVSHDGFDIALAHKLLKDNSIIVCNDFFLKGRERILVVSGPNQGGKTTFARTFGQLHYLAAIGCPVPGRDAQLFLFDQLFTHFEKQEKVENLRGKLEDDLVRIHEILGRATGRSIIILNEIFTSTTIRDEIFLSKKLMERMVGLGVLGVWVTFADELASFGPQTVSAMSTIVPGNPASRTFKIERRPADGLAYALAIAQKYRVTYDAVRERIGS